MKEPFAAGPSASPMTKLPGHARIVAAATIGTALESADLTIYAFLAVSLSKAFFPADDPTISLLITFLTYGSTFVIRPMGAIVFGTYADKVGRKKALAIILALMGIGSLMIGLMPSYATIGIWAPIGIVFARVLQGFSVGGEQGSAIALLTERDKARSTEFLGYLLSSVGLGQIIAAGAGAILAYSLTPAQVDDWGWRLCFIFGALIYPVGLYIRRATQESEEFSKSVKVDQPIMVVIRKYPAELLCTMFMSSATTVMLYFSIYLPSYAVSRLGMGLSSSLAIMVASGFVLFVLAPLGGLIADRIGRLRMMLAAVIVMIPLPWILLSWLAANPDSMHLFLTQFAIAVAMAVYGPAQVSTTANIFPVEVRASGASLSSALAGSLVGGFSLFGFAVLGAVIPHPAAPSLYVVGASTCALIAILTLYRRYGATLNRSL